MDRDRGGRPVAVFAVRMVRVIPLPNYLSV